MAREPGAVASLTELEGELRRLLEVVAAAERAASATLARSHPDHADSARNLLHYIAIRQHDLRPLQRDLAAYGLSSLGRMEAMVRSWLLTLIETTSALRSERRRQPIWGPLEDGTDVLRHNRRELLGGVHGGARSTRIMVTMPAEAATEATLIPEMAAAGMDISRVNCAHDDEGAWATMIRRVRELGDDVRVAMDLAGPKLRTGPLEPGPRVRKVKPERDARGRVTRPARVTLGAGAGDLPVTSLRRGALSPGDILQLTDARGREREYRVAEVGADALVVECDRTSYFETGAEFIDAVGEVVATVGELPAHEQHLLVRVGDELRLQRDMTPQPATASGPHRIGCSLEAAFADAAPGESALFDDGKIAGLITEVTPDEIVVRVTRAGVDGVKLRAEKGINFPDTELRIPALTEDDRAHLPFVAAHADIVNLSFVRRAQDVADLITQLEHLGAHDVGIVLKIETRTAFEQLPQMLLEALRWRKVGVMIARGDLAVEIGFDRLAEVQEEILWVCEAARVPVIWATEVLNSLAKTGLPSRAEVTDAAMSRRAECVMLNKGPYIVTAIEQLASILERMGGHVSKKRALLRPLESFSLRSTDSAEATGTTE